MHKTLGQFIRERRTGLGLTQEQLADRIGEGVRQAEISRLEQDRVSLPRRQRLEAIAAALDVSIGDLLVTTGWIDAGHMPLPGTVDEARPIPEQALEDAIVALSIARNLLAHTAELLERAEHQVAMAMGTCAPALTPPDDWPARRPLDRQALTSPATMDTSPPCR